MSVVWFVLVQLVGCLTRPTVGRCPGSWYVANVRPDGVFLCAEPSPPWVCAGPGGCVSTTYDPTITGRVYCTRPIWRDQHTVACR